jgi:hypothetical protein
VVVAVFVAACLIYFFLTRWILAGDGKEKR